MTRALVCGAGGFVGSHLVRALKKSGCWVRGVDQKRPEFSPSMADEFLLVDLRRPEDCTSALSVLGGFDEVYQLSADMGGMRFIHDFECEIMRNNVLINTNMVHAAATMRVPRYFFSSSVCVYRDMNHGECTLVEEGAYPAFPDNEYGWEKLYSERVAMAYGKRAGMQVRIARFENSYGPEGTWMGGREKAPAAICRKVAEMGNADIPVEIWGDGSAVRCFTFVEDTVSGVLALMRSGIQEPANVGSSEYVSVAQLVNVVREVAGKSNQQTVRSDGPVGVHARNFSTDRIRSTGWQAEFSLREGIALTYPWIRKQVEITRHLEGRGIRLEAA